MELLAVFASPLLGALFLILFGSRRGAGWINVAMSAVTLAATAMLALRTARLGAWLSYGDQFYVDAFNIVLALLTALVGFTCALYARRYIQGEVERGRLSVRRLRIFYPAYQLFLGATLLALLTNNIGLMWVALEAATLATVLMVALYKTRASLEAAWKYFILCGVGIALALFGTILLYFAAERVAGGEGMTALLWTHLNFVKSGLEARVVGLAFIFYLVGYGTKAGLAPLHNWLPDVYAEGPTPVSGALSGLLTNAAIYAILRVKTLAVGSIGVVTPGGMLLFFGLLSVVVGAFLLWRQRDIKRLFAYSSVEHMGLIAFAFGLGGPVANFAALLHLTVHTLTKSALLFSSEQASQLAGSAQLDEMHGLIDSKPAVGWALMLGSLAILGMPPFGLFASEFCILSTVMREQPWAAPILLIALGVAFAGVLVKIQRAFFGEAGAVQTLRSPSLAPVYAHLALVLMLGLYIPPVFAEWLRAAARLIG